MALYKQFKDSKEAFFGDNTIKIYSQENDEKENLIKIQKKIKKKTKKVPKKDLLEFIILEKAAKFHRR